MTEPDCSTRSPGAVQLWSAWRAGREPTCAISAAAIQKRRAEEPGSAQARAAGALPWSYGAWSERARRHHEAGDGYPEPPSWLRDAFYVRAVSEVAAAAEVARRASVLSPVLVVAGAQDGVAGTAPARLVASCYPASRLEVLAECGHWPWVDTPTEFRDLVAGFLDG